MNTQEIIDRLNYLRSKELFAIQQYMNHHYTVDGMDFTSIQDFEKSIAIVEMNHAEALGEKINMLGGEPITNPAQVEQMKGASVITSDNPKEMLMADLNLERGAIQDYTNAINDIGDSDPGIHKMLQDILADEEEHADTFSSWLSEKPAYQIPTVQQQGMQRGAA
ncbi:MAG TPA: ferritin-like domain-containing protein [Candidatus Aquicultor sp.]